jgi:hypothetical protein
MEGDRYPRSLSVGFLCTTRVSRVRFSHSQPGMLFMFCLYISAIEKMFSSRENRCLYALLILEAFCTVQLGVCLGAYRW